MKTLLTLFILFFSSISLNSNAGIFDKTVCLETDAQFRLGNIYLPNNDKPFTGNVLCEYENGQTKLKGKVKDGKLDGELFMWYENGQKKIEATFDGAGEYVAFLPSERGTVLAWDVNGNSQSTGDFVITCNNFISKYIFANNWIRRIDLFEGNNLLSQGMILFHENGKLSSEDWKVDGRDWVIIDYNENGQKEYLEEWSYTSMYPNGIAFAQGWHENGQKHFEGHTLPGYNLDGIYTEWNNNGQKVLERNYIAGEKWGEKTWFDNGQQKSITDYVFNLKDGVEITFFENGQKKSETAYSENNKKGFEMIWNIDGELIKETFHK